jgi:hypothetical protein
LHSVFETDYAYSHHLFLGVLPFSLDFTRSPVPLF